MDNRDAGIVVLAGAISVDHTVQRLEALLQAKGVHLFAVIDHSGEAKKVGLDMRPTNLLIFGDPRAGTPIMIASPSAALDLPLKILVSEDAEGRIWISYNDPEYLQARHGFPHELLRNIGATAVLAETAAAESAGK